MKTQKKISLYIYTYLHSYFFKDSYRGPFQTLRYSNPVQYFLKKYSEWLNLLQ